MELLLAFALGSGIGMTGFWIFNRIKIGGYESIASRILEKAEQEAANSKRSNELIFRQKQLEQHGEIEKIRQDERRKIQREEERLQQRQDKLETRLSLCDKKLSDVERRETALLSLKTQLENEKQEINNSRTRITFELEKLSGIGAMEARTILIQQMQNDIKTDAANMIRRLKSETEENADKEASRIIATAINRMAVSCVSEGTVNTVALPNDEMKGRIIGREGRNIRALEHETGVNFIIDDTPGAIVLSCYDSIRLQIAKIALTELIADGRIYPTRIEEIVEKAKQTIKKRIKEHGEDAALSAGIMNLHPEIITLLGKLKFRFSYSQNVLEHSLEVCHLMGMIAAELGLDVRMAKRIGLLHDMGKAVSHEMEGAHAVIGHDLALKYGETKEVANGIGCHHHEMDPITIEGSLCSAADAISAARPGARIGAVEEYIKRLRQLEEMALAIPGVDKAYAMQSGREVRVIVQPGTIDDDGLVILVRELTKRIERELDYPGKIKVTAIREKRVTEYAV